MYEYQRKISSISGKVYTTKKEVNNSQESRYVLQLHISTKRDIVIANRSLEY